MKKILVITGVVLIMLGMVQSRLSAQPTDNAGNYLEYFNEMYRPIQKDMWDYTSAVAKGKRAKVVDSRRKNLLTHLRMAEKRAIKAKDYKSDIDLRDAVAGWMNASQVILEEDYEKIMDLEEIAEDSYDAMEAYLKAKELASEHMNDKSAALSSEVARFAGDNNITLIEDQSKLSKKLEQANKVFKYHNEVYLLFFKCFKQEAYLLDAVSAGDLNGIEQNKGTLVKYVDECEEKLKGVHDINTDKSIKLACQEVFDFYRKETAEDLAVMTEFYLEKEKFERIKKAFESRSASSRTKTDVDKFNQAVNDFNEITETFNEKNNDLNKRRGKVLDNWNKSVDKFFSKHAT